LAQLVILVTGDRNWTNESVIRRILSRFPKGTIVVHGNARGADSIAGKIAYELQMDVRPYRADWEKYGRAAGPIRNRQMYTTEHPDVVLAFHENIEQSKGTKDMIGIAKKGNTPVILYNGVLGLYLNPPLPDLEMPECLKDKKLTDTFWK
jgi:hypothetical protein